MAPILLVLAWVRPWWMDPIIFGPICCTTLFIVLAAYLWIRKTLRRHSLLARGGVQTVGTVVEHVSKPLDASKPKGDLRYRPVIEFVTAEGRPVRHTRETAGPLPDPPIGTKVSLIYDPANPDDVIVLGDIGS